MVNIELRPNGLTIDSTGGATFTHERSSDDFIGTLLVNFNTDYSGGEIEVSYKNRIAVFDEKQCWVAVHKDCSYKIKPITSGRRVDMVFDVYSFDRYAAFDAVNYGNKHHPYCLDISAEKEKSIVTAMYAELEQYDTVVVNLAGHYATNHTTNHTTSNNTTNTLLTILSDQLTIADSTLYTFLSRHFDVTVEHVELKCTVDEDTYRMTVTDANYITNPINPTIPTNTTTTATPTTTSTTHTTTTTNTTTTSNTNSTKIVLSNRFHPNNLVWESTFKLPSSDDEDSCPPKELIYHTVALVVRKRV